MDPRTIDPRTARLRELMAEHGLTAREVGDLLNRQRMTVKLWRIGKTRVIPAHTLEVLEARLAARERAA